MKHALIGLVVITALSVSGCYRMRLELVDASVQKPSNVALFFQMDDENGAPKPGVAVEQFKIYEDGKLISTYESKQTILNPEVSTVRYTLLLLDMSGSVVESGQVPQLQEAVGAFLEGIGENEKVAIYAFDGREEIQPLAELGAREATLARKNELLSKWETKDPSTNLHGAILQGVEKLEAAKAGSEVPLRFGTLVIFTDGTDRAHRATAEDAVAAIRDSETTAFVIGLGGEVDQAEGERFGKDGFVRAADKAAMTAAFKDVADRINARGRSYYMLSYCSPSRAGSHELEVVAELEDQKGKLAYRFDAEGFEPDCDPNKTPEFEIPATGKAAEEPPPAAEVKPEADKKPEADVKVKAEEKAPAVKAGDKAKPGSQTEKATVFD
jgi:hypothetical protein